MKYLIIENGRGFYSTDGLPEHKKPLDNISKEDLLSLVNTIIDSDGNFEMDAYNEDTLKNAAHRVIYKSIQEKFEDLINKRVTFQDEKSNLYRTAIEKYNVELGAE